MKTIQLTLKNEKETLAFGEKLASFLKPSDIIVLTGDLGAGKTKLTEGILRYFGLSDEISSRARHCVQAQRHDWRYVIVFLQVIKKAAFSGCLFSRVSRLSVEKQIMLE